MLIAAVFSGALVALTESSSLPGIALIRSAILFFAHVPDMTSCLNWKPYLRVKLCKQSVFMLAHYLLSSHWLVKLQ